MVTKDYGAGVSGYLDPEGKAYETTVIQASKPILDKELNLFQDLSQQARTGIPSGWLSPDVVDTSEGVSPIFTLSATANEYQFPALVARVNDWRVPVMYTGSATPSNAVDMGAGPVGVGAKRTDLVFLEVWRKLLSASPDTSGKSLSGRIWRNGNVKIASADDATLNLTDEILDGAVGSETSKRVQIQYRVRVYQGVNLATYPQGLGDVSIVAHTVPPDASTPDGAATAFSYANQSASGDPGLWVAGDGNPANGLGSVDGYMYAIPLCAVFRRNTTAFDRDTNHNGGVATPGPSDRPDALFHDILSARDFLDLRPNVHPLGWDFQELLAKNVNYLYDNSLQTEYEITPLGGGSVGHTNLWADAIGTVPAGVADIERHFDAVARRFSDRATLETVWVEYTPSDQNGGGPTWTVGDFFIIDPTALPVYPYSNLNVSSVAPSDISILAVTAALSSGGSTLTNQSAFAEGDTTDELNARNTTDVLNMGVSFEGVGQVPAGAITATLVAGTPLTQDQRLFLKLLVSYPPGQGLSKTPTGDFASDSFVDEAPGTLDVAAPYSFQALESQTFDYPHREVELTYRTTDVTFETYLTISSGAFNRTIYVPDRIGTVVSIENTTGTNAGTYTGPVDLSDDGYRIRIDSQVGTWSNAATPSVSGDEIVVTYEAVRPIPHNGCQFTLWYETRSPQTVRDSLLGSTLQVTPRYICPNLYSLVTGSGSEGEAYPFPYQYVQTPGVYPSSGPSLLEAFDGDHALDSSGVITMSDFNADAGFLQVPTLIPAVPNPQSLILERAPGDIDIEGRSFFKEVPAGYIPAAFGQPLASPKRHINCLPVICELTVDGAIGPKGTILLVMFSRWAPFDSENKVAFDSNLADNFTSASVYRLKGNPLAPRR